MSELSILKQWYDRTITNQTKDVTKAYVFSYVKKVIFFLYKDLDSLYNRSIK